jgi:hypothetical protein
MDQGTAIVIAAFIGAAVAIIGFAVNAVGSVVRSRHQRELATEAAVSALTIERIRDTERVIQAQLASFRAMVVAPTDRHAQARVRRAEAVADRSLQADMPVIGEIDAVVQLVQTYIQVIGKIPVGPFPALWMKPLLRLRNPWNQDDVDALENARAACLEALQRQEERVRRGEPLATYTREELAGKVDLDLMEVVTDRLIGRRRT